MTVEQWLEAACADADARHLPELKPLLAALSLATRALRDADWNDDPGPPESSTKAEGPGLRTESDPVPEGPGRRKEAGRS